MTWEEFLTTEFGLWVDTRSSTDNTFRGSSGPVEKRRILLQIKEAAQSSDGDLTRNLFSVQCDAVAHLATSDLSEILPLKSRLDDKKL